MPRVSALQARENLLKALRGQAVSSDAKDRARKVAELEKSLKLARSQKFPASAIKALETDLAAIQDTEPDPLIHEKVDCLERWIAAEKDYLRLFKLGPVKSTKKAKRPNR